MDEKNTQNEAIMLRVIYTSILLVNTATMCV